MKWYVLLWIILSSLGCVMLYSNECITDDPQASISSSNKSLELTSGMAGDVPPMIQAVDLIEVT